MGYVLKALFWNQEVAHDERTGAPLKYKRWNEGDVITDISDEDKERLLKAGAIEDEDAKDEEAPADAEAPAAPAQDSTAPEGDDYDNEAEWPVDELQSELGERDLDKTGDRATLIARLREDDAKNPSS